MQRPVRFVGHSNNATAKDIRDASLCVLSCCFVPLLNHGYLFVLLLFSTISSLFLSFNLPFAFYKTHVVYIFSFMT